MIFKEDHLKAVWQKGFGDLLPEPCLWKCCKQRPGDEEE